MHTVSFLTLHNKSFLMKFYNRYFLCSLSIILFSFLFNFVYAQTDIYGGLISIDTVWTSDASSSPYIIHAPAEGDTAFSISAGTTLTIEAGTIVKFDYGQSIKVLGNLVTNGTENNKVYFTSIDDRSAEEIVTMCEGFEGDDYDFCLTSLYPYNNDWSGIEIYNGGKIVLNNSIVSYAENALYGDFASGSLDNVSIINCVDGVYLTESSFNINNSSIKNLYGDAVTLDSTSTISFVSSNIEEIDGDGINVVYNSAINIEDSNIFNISGDALFLYSNSTTSINSSVIDTVGGDGFNVFNNSIINFQNSSLKNITGQILHMYGESSSSISNSIIENSSDGIIFYDNSFLNINDSQIKNVAGRDSWTPFIEFYLESHLNLINSSLQNILGIAIQAYGTSWGNYATTTLTVSSSTISDGNDIGLQLYGDKFEANIIKSKITNFESDGIQTFSNAYIKISDSEISNNDNGIVSWGSNLEIKNSNIFGNINYGISNNPIQSGALTIKAVNNWWGNVSGPFNTETNASGTANKVSWNVEFDPWLINLPGTKQKCCSNVMFLPGLEASRLYKTDENGNEKRIWEPGIFHDNSELFLDTEGKSLRSDIYTKDIIDNAYLPIKGNIYFSLISSMNEMKTDGLINDWKAVPYDWRLSLSDLLESGKEYPDGKIYYSGELASTSNPYIISELRRLASSSATGKVTVIAHSNGGLITKELTNKLGDEASALIDQIIFVAVPQAGTPLPLGHCCMVFSKDFQKIGYHYLFHHLSLET